MIKRTHAFDNQNKHYATLGEFQPINVFEAWANHNTHGMELCYLMPACYKDVLKYLARFSVKSDDMHDWVKDLRKASQYIENMIFHIEQAIDKEKALHESLMKIIEEENQEEKYEDFDFLNETPQVKEICNMLSEAIKEAFKEAKNDNITIPSKDSDFNPDRP